MAADPLTDTAIDEIFNTNLSDFEDDPFSDKLVAKATRDDKAVLSPRSSLKRKADGIDKENDGLGLDQEVKIVKKRKPIAKLDDARLLSEPGIPRLRALMRSGQLSRKLRIKGKGHEFTDAARLLNHFQLWLDNLYPRAKFADALQLTEKAGHSKRMQIMRNEWINEGKPGYRKDEQTAEDLHEEPDLFAPTQQQNIDGPSTGSDHAQQSTSTFGSGLDDDALFIPDANMPLHNEGDEPDEDELDALLAEQDSIASLPAGARRAQQQEDSEGEDDLDALLAEQDTLRSRSSAPIQSIPRTTVVDEDDDDLEALLAEHEAMTEKSAPAASTGSHLSMSDQPKRDLTHEEDSDEEELEALLAQQRTASKLDPETDTPSLPTPQHTSSPARSTDDTPRASTEGKLSDITTTAPLFSSSPVPNNPEDVDLDDLDALLASQEARTNARMQQQEQEEQAVSTPRANKSTEVPVVDEDDEEDFLGSPVPNEDSQ